MLCVLSAALVTGAEPSVAWPQFRGPAGGSGNTFSASPWAADGKIYLLSEDGHTFVIEAGDTYVELSNNSVDEMSLASRRSRRARSSCQRKASCTKSENNPKSEI